MQQIPKTFSMYSVLLLWFFFLFQTCSLSLPCAFSFLFTVSFLLLLYSEYLISSCSGTIQLPLQVATVAFFFFPPHLSHWQFFINAAFFATLTGITSFIFSYSALISILYFIQYREQRLSGVLCQKMKGWKQRVFQKQTELFIAENMSLIL